jgi:lysophospholipase L1-like esterase
MKNLFVNGCSFLNRRHSDGVDVKFSTAECIKDLGGFESMTNLARGGRGNDRIFLTTVAYFEGEPERKKDTFVMIGWSSSQRLDYPTRNEFKPMKPLDESWCTIKMLDDNEQNINKMARIEPNMIHWMITRYYQNVLGLQNYLKVNKIPYVFYNSITNILENDKKDHKKWLQAVDQKRFFKIDTCHHQWAKDRNLLISSADGHPTGDGHSQWSEELYKFIKDNGLLEYGN